MLSKIREFLQGKKVYILCIGTIAGVVVAWIDGGVTTKDALLTIIAALTGISFKAGVTRDIQNMTPEK